MIGNIPEDFDAGMGAMVGLTDRRIAFGGRAHGLMSADGTTVRLSNASPADNAWEGVAPPPVQVNYFTLGATAGGGEAFFANTWGLVAVDLTTAVHRFVVPPDYKVHAIRGDGTLSERVALPGGGYRSLIYDSGGFDYGGSTSVWHLLPDHRTVVDLVGVTDEYAYAPDPGPIASTPIGFVRSVARSGSRVYVAEDMSVVHVADLATGTLQRFAGSYDEARLMRCLSGQFAECYSGRRWSRGRRVTRAAGMGRGLP